MKFSIKDLLFVSVNLAVLGVAGTLLYADFSKRIDAGSRKTVGTIVFKKKTAERKYSGQVLWEEVSRQAPVYDRDTLRTADDSQAVLTLHDGTRLELDQNTLIVVSMSPRGAKIGFTRGGLSTSRGAKSGAVKIATGSGEVSLGDGAVALQSTASNRLSLQVISGQARLQQSGGTKTLQAGSAAEVVGTGVQIDRDPVKLLHPRDGLYFVTAGSGSAAVSFAWQEQGRVLFEYSTEPDFRRPVSAAVAGGKTRAVLRPGIYYWRVRRDAGQKVAPVRRLTVAAEQPAQLLEPAQNTVFPAVAGKSPLVRFSWRRSELASSWELQLSKERTFSGTIRRYTAAFPEISIDDLTPGRWYWRLEHRYGFKTEQPVVSRTGSFEIRAVAQLPVPGPVTTAQQVTVLQQKKAPLTVSWQDPFSVYPEYTVEFSRTPDFTGQVRRVKSTAAWMRLPRQLADGKYYWRVRGVTAAGKETAPSKPAVVEVLPVQPPRLDTPQRSALPEAKNTVRVRFQWNDPNRSGSYRIRISRHRDMRDPVSADLDSTAYSRDFQGGGALYWQVAVMENGKPVKWSTARRYRLTGSLAPVTILEPAANSELDMQQRRDIRFRWNPVRGADRYRFRLVYSNGRFEKEVVQMTVAGQSLTFTALEKLQRGSFYWTVQGEQTENGETVALSPAVKNFIRITLRRIKRAPVLIMPGVFYVD